jgi:hypothetical protein
MNNTQTTEQFKVTLGEVKRLGRPVNPESPRQLRLKEQAELRAQGLLRRGRPVGEDSIWAAKRAARLEKLAEGVELKRGRPVNNDSARQQRINDLNARRANGTLKLGRPKMVKETVEETVA